METRLEKIKQLREETGLSIQECKRAIEEADGNTEKAKEILKIRGKELAGKRTARIAGQGIVESYIHPTGKVGVLLDLRCESDFVARGEDFKKLAHELCLQIASMEPEALEDLMAQPWIRDQARAIKDLVDEYIAKIGENIVVNNFTRYEI
ncbi:MAG: elongation factor Ts [Candidatus Nealsonbacteria bacterium]|nr:elongation factor Ts [Candidatus Nealsonbacteria bacterium]